MRSGEEGRDSDAILTLLVDNKFRQKYKIAKILNSKIQIYKDAAQCENIFILLVAMVVNMNYDMIWNRTGKICKKIPNLSSQIQ